MTNCTKKHVWSAKTLGKEAISMKKILCRILPIILSIMVIGSVVPLTTSLMASENGKMSVATAEGKRGETVDINVSIDDNPGIVTMYLNMNYDKTRLKLTEVKNGSVLKDPAHGGNLSLVPYSLNWDGSLLTENITENGVIVTLSFEVLSDAPMGDAEVSITYDTGNIYNMNIEDIAFDITNGKITITHDHVAGEWETTSEPSCLAAGSKVQKCTICDETLKTETIPALGHDFGAWQIRSNAECTTDGEEYHICTRCGVDETRGISATGHIPGEWQIIKEATCTEPGERVQKCTVCQTVLDTQTISATGHTAGEWEITLNATCTESGTRVKECTVCGEIMDSETITALGHSYGNWVVVTPATFHENGLEKRVCSRCNHEETRIIQKLSDSHVHSFTGTEVIVLAPTCTVDGSKNVYCIEPECGQYQTISISATGHTEGEWEETKAATCTETGTRVQKCTVCQTVLDTQTIPATGHTAGEWETTQTATCTESGTRVKKCTVCGEIVDSETIAALGHSYGSWSVVTPATFHENGLEKRVCSRCNHEETRIIPKLSESHVHSFTGTEDIVLAPTCTVEGSKKVYCTEPDCGQYQTITIPATGHTPGAWEETKAATCTETGTRVKKCTVCGTVLNSETIAALGHDLGAWQSRTAVTCTTDGLDYHVCSRCDYEETRIVPATGHSWSDWTIKTPATETADGVEHRTCSKCNEEETQVYSINGITLNLTTAKTTYFEGSDIDLTALSIIVAYSNDTTENIAVTADRITGYDKTAVGEQNVTVTYGKHTATFKVKVVSRQSVDDINAKIDAIVIDDLTVDDAEDIFDIKDAYDALSDFEKNAIIDPDKLLGAVKTVNALLYPSIDELYMDGMVGVKAEPGVLPYDATFKVVAKTEDVKVLEKLRNEFGANSLFVGLFDITLTDAQGNLIQPNGIVNIKIKLPAEYADGKDLVLVYISDDGSYTIVNATFVDGYAMFETDHFSQYGIVKKLGTTTDNPTTPTTPTAPTAPANSTKSEPTNTVITSPKTGDMSMMVTGIVLMMLLLSLVVFLRHGKKVQ
jgi:hypothetical protein